VLAGTACRAVLIAVTVAVRVAVRVAVVVAITACQKPPQVAAGRVERVVSLTPSTTEIVAAVGGLPLLVGVDQFSTDPPEVRSLPKVGDFLAPSFEAILALHPDIVLLDSVQTRVIDGLNASGIRNLALPLQTVADVRAAMLRVGSAIGRDAAARDAAARLDAELRAAQTRAAVATAAGNHRPRVLFVVDRRPGGFGNMVGAGPDTFIDDLIVRAGGINVLRDASATYVTLSIEDVIARAPEVILDAVHDPDVKRARADWNLLGSVPAVAAGRVVVLDDVRFVAPGPRLGQALTQLVDVIWGPPGAPTDSAAQHARP
jgi:cobalamin transport system substrate-binding protein